MIIKKEPHWYPIHMLPLYVEMCENSLDVATKDLSHLKNSQLHPQQLDSNLIHRALNMYATKTEDTWVFFEQCKKWLNDSPNDEELKLIARVEKTANQLDVINHEILDLIRNIKLSIID